MECLSPDPLGEAVRITQVHVCNRIGPTVPRDGSSGVRRLFPSAASVSLWMNPKKSPMFLRRPANSCKGEVAQPAVPALREKWWHCPTEQVGGTLVPARAAKSRNKNEGVAQIAGTTGLFVTKPGHSGGIRSVIIHYDRGILR
jgi:hypothetical protein